MHPRPQVTGNGHLLSPDGSPAIDVFQGVTSVALAVVDTTGYTSVAWDIVGSLTGSVASLALGAGFTNTLTLSGDADALDIRVKATGSDGRYSINIVRVVIPTPVAGLVLLDHTDASVEEAARDKVNAIAVALDAGGGGGGSGNATSIQSVPVDATAPTLSGQVLAYDGATKYVARKLTLDDLGPAASTSLAKTGGTALLEIGATLATPPFTSAPSATPTSAIVTDTDSHTQDVTSTPTGWTSAYSYTKSTNAQSVTWTVTDIIGGVTKTATVTQSWGTRLYYGASSSVSGPFNAAFIAALPTSVLGTSRARSIGYTLAAGERFVIALPQSFGAPTFTVGGFLISPDTLATGVSVTNPQGVAVLCDVYAVSNFATGASSATVVVS